MLHINGFGDRDATGYHLLADMMITYAIIAQKQSKHRCRALDCGQCRTFRAFNVFVAVAVDMVDMVDGGGCM